MAERDLERVLTTAKEQMLTQGQHAPLVVVFTATKSYRIPITSGWGEDADTRAKALLLLGRSFAQQQKVDAEKIRSVFLVTEVWAVDAKSGEPSSPLPEEHPDRRECLSVLELRSEGKTLRDSMYLIDILRAGGVVDLGSPQKKDHVESLLLTSFFSGVASAKLSDAQLLNFMNQLDSGLQ